MSKHRDSEPIRHYPATPADVALLLRAHSERQWLSREVIPVVRQIETGERLPEEQLPAARAYLEAIWVKALRRARETDAERGHLDAVRVEALHPNSRPLVARARRYHAAVRALREAVARRVAPLIAAPGELLAEELLPEELPRYERADLHDLIR